MAGVGGNWIGIVTPGPLFILRRDGLTQMIYKTPGEKKSKSFNLKVDGFALDHFYTITVIRERADAAQTGSRWTYLLDGKKVGEAVTANPNGNANLAIWVIGKTIKAAIDDFRMTEIKKEK